ncbi:DUF624 domain-containing protein [Cryobacterium arcticum]|uniref:DUF624 domain-containing protein n=1 Tax=Cryobacterium arcticum TaxID=670052 RepID=A0A317ZL70_9MICO|nr:DUF624 domain-containing protein [Cryobacterium arcticum]PXA67250.1 hypothetical protein CTB96_10865 [Cryobacterium arcticum]
MTASGRLPRGGSRPPAAQRGWEHRLLAALAYPANLAFVGVAALLLAVPIVTILPASIAAGRALRAWLQDGETAVFTATFREFGATWRRTLPLGVGSVVVVFLLLVDSVFLGQQLSAAEAGASPVALILAAAAVPVAVAVTLLLLALPVAGAKSPDATARQWLVESGYLIARRPIQALLLLATVAFFVLTCYLLPTLVPFFGLSLPVYLAIVTLGREKPDTSASAPNATGGSTPSLEQP